MRRVVIFALILMLTAGVALSATAVHTILPTGWSLHAPQGPVVTTATMPQGIAVSPDGTQVAVIDSGVGAPDVRIYEAASLTSPRIVTLKGAFGKPVWQDSRYLWVAQGAEHSAAHIDSRAATIDNTVDTGSGWNSAVALSPDGKHLAVSDDIGSRVVVINTQDGKTENTVSTDAHPGDLAYAPDGTLAIAQRGSNAVRLVRFNGVHNVIVGKHPSAVLFSKDGQTLFATAADDDRLAVINTASETVAHLVDLHLRWGYGASPNSITQGADGTLYISCGAANAVAVVRADHLVGWLNAGWYPSGVAINSSALFVADGKGEGSRPNPQFNPFRYDSSGYVAASLVGSVRKIALPASVQTADVLADAHGNWPRPKDTVIRPNGPIKHVIYIIKENRSYDQVLGDLPQGDGDKSLTIFGAQITPNEHALSLRFGLFDRAFTNSQVSADGHNWTDGAFATDYLERFWPNVYGNRRTLYDFEDGASASVPHNGFLWDSAARSHISYRNYGEFATNPLFPNTATLIKNGYATHPPGVNETPSRGDDIAAIARAKDAIIATQRVTSQMPNLRDHTAPHFATFDLEISDLSRYASWLTEFRQYEAHNNLPALEIMKFPNDHTSGTRNGALTPQAFVAQNDYAVGKLIDTVSHSKYWKSTAIFVVEDDAQNGPDHVDDQRSTMYIASAYAKGGVHHERYPTTSVIRTIDLILGLQPLSVYDATARPMYEAFGTVADVRPYNAIAPKIDIMTVNKKTAYGSELSAKMDFRQADRVNPDVLNTILYGNARRH